MEAFKSLNYGIKLNGSFIVYRKKDNKEIARYKNIDEAISRIRSLDKNKKSS